MVSANCRVLICCTCHFQGGSPVLASSVCGSLVSDFCPDTRGRRWTRFGAHLVRRAVGREESCRQSHWRAGSARSLRAALGSPRSRVRTSPVYTAQAPSRLLCRELAKAGPGLRALPRSKPLRFRFSGPPHRRRLGWASVLCPSQARAAQGARCLASIPPPTPPLGFLGVQRAHLLRCAVCLFWAADLWLPPSWRMPTVQNPRKSWLAMKPACSLLEDASLGPRSPLPALAALACPSPAEDGRTAAGQPSSVLCSVSGPGCVLGQGFSRDGCPTVWFAISS